MPGRPRRCALGRRAAREIHHQHRSVDGGVGTGGGVRGDGRARLERVADPRLRRRRRRPRDRAARRAGGRHRRRDLHGRRRVDQRVGAERADRAGGRRSNGGELARQHGGRDGRARRHVRRRRHVPRRCGAGGGRRHEGARDGARRARPRRARRRPRASWPRRCGPRPRRSPRFLLGALLPVIPWLLGADGHGARPRSRSPSASSRRRSSGRSSVVWPPAPRPLGAAPGAHRLVRVRVTYAVGRLVGSACDAPPRRASGRAGDSSASRRAP